MVFTVKVLKFFVGLLLVPFCIAISQTLWELVTAIRPESDALFPAPAVALIAGLGLWLLLYTTLPRPVRSYILAHELTHALWGAMMGASIHSIKVSAERGAVTMSKNNFIITLAPYFFPLYTVLTVAAYYLLGMFFEVEKYHLFWLGAIGLTWGFHLTFTISALMQHQTDIHQHGRLFSYAVIYLCNVLGICLWVVTVSAVTLELLIGLMQERTLVAWHLACALAMKAWSVAEELLQSKPSG
jgi:hypothetical protein